MHVDVLTVGMTYRDLILTGLRSLPRLGEEAYGSQLLETWGGIANMTRVCRALTLRTALVTPVGDDEASGRMLADMAARGVDVSLAVRHTGWRLPTTLALCTDSDRAMATVEHPPPTPLAAHLDEASFSADAVVVDMRDPVLPWLARARRQGATVFASRGFDPSGAWGREHLAEVGSCDVWMLNEQEACGFARLDDPLAAARWLSTHAPLVVVTRGARGMLAVDAAAGVEAEVPAFPVTPATTTGAGDATLAAFVAAHRLPLGLAEWLEVAAFIVAAALERADGVACPPTLADLLDRDDRGDQRVRRVQRRLRGLP